MKKLSDNQDGNGSGLKVIVYLMLIWHLHFISRGLKAVEHHIKDEVHLTKSYLLDIVWNLINLMFIISFFIFFNRIKQSKEGMNCL